jgi:hypothetical protein
MTRRYHIILASWILWLATSPNGWSFYNPNTGRWLSRDPIKEPGARAIQKPSALNRSPHFNPLASQRSDLPPRRHETIAPYTFVDNDPSIYIDMDGRQAAPPMKEFEHRTSCCPEYALWTPCSQICKMAYLDFRLAQNLPGGGTVICFHGKKCGCLFPDDQTHYYPGECPLIDAIFQDHEDHHALQDATCTGCGLRFADEFRDTATQRQVECPRRRESLLRLEIVVDDLEGKCASVANAWIERLRRWTTENCP